MRKGLDKAKIMAVSLEMIEKDGRENFSLHKLAEKLDVKTASLYNHVRNLDELVTAISVEVIHRLIQTEEAAIRGKTGDAAIHALACAYFQFGREHYNLYQIFMESRQPHSEVLEREGIHILGPIFQAFSEVKLTDTEKIHYERILRSLIHGFIAQEQAGFFTYGHIPAEESFRLGLDCFIAGLHAAESRAQQ